MPTNREKRNLPFDIRKMYCQSVDIHQQITYYEMNIIPESEFIEEVRKIVKKYEDVKETSAILSKN
jgi:hypothetical protein